MAAFYCTLVDHWIIFYILMAYLISIILNSFLIDPEPITTVVGDTTTITYPYNKTKTIVHTVFLFSWLIFVMINHRKCMRQLAADDLGYEPRRSRESREDNVESV